MSAIEIRPDDDWWLAVNDKVVHLGLYTVMGGALAFGRVTGGTRIPHAMMVLVGWLYGATDEWHQSFVPSRAPSAGDWIADATGVLIGYTVILFLLQLRTRAEGVETTESTA